jgi:hypothetical protein
MEEMAKAVGIEVDDDTPLATEEMLLKRDRDRWELDPASADEHYSHFQSKVP